VAREPLSAERQFLLALVYTEARQEASARKALQRCVALDPRCVEAYVNLDALYLRAGDLKACRALASMATREARLSGGTFRFWTHPAQRPPHMVQVRGAHATRPRALPCAAASLASECEQSRDRRRPQARAARAG
jgi:hypothetical protein